MYLFHADLICGIKKLDASQLPAEPTAACPVLFRELAGLITDVLSEQQVLYSPPMFLHVVTGDMRGNSSFTEDLFLGSSNAQGLVCCQMDVVGADLCVTFMLWKQTER